MSEHAEHPPTNYIKIWAILVALLVVSVIGPMFGIKVVTLLTAFGIAVVKAYLVAKNFMHINLEPKFVTYFVVTALVFMLIQALRAAFMRRGIRTVELSWILESNERMRRIIESLGGEPYKRYRIYEKNLDGRSESA